MKFKLALIFLITFGLSGLGNFLFIQPAAAAIERLAELERIAYIDSLTGLPNRRYAEITLHARMDELQRYGWLFGVIFIDIDNFKSVNDRYGHQCGDEVLKTVAKTLQNSVRSFDVISRWGGEEYLAVIAPQLAVSVGLALRQAGDK